MTDRSSSRGRALPLLLTALLLGAAGCAGSTKQDLGRVPIPSAPGAPIVVTAAPGHAQLVAMGDRVHLDLGAEQGEITATGPELANSDPAPGAAPASQSAGSLTVTLHLTAGQQQLSAQDLTATDELGHGIPLTADNASVTVDPGHDGVLHLSGTFAAGHSTLTWNAAGKPLATWDFEVELD
ncbi:hypothetical protein OG500_05525 [Kitasatospora sp. NBC_01250]|uniref:hypothetical protein n=1 Tax=unclassified Kitasatospora TaxID=2633591 RepID=UPI002E0D9FAC|nr:MULTISPECIES: hypothetical protein [unclassified Kitasatospora]WSJ65579.1 hypothetical protein OG294_05375 [Kitasatospora sp. NBC_01302]